MIRCIDLFCGLGGLTHGLASGGVRVDCGIDIDPECRFPYEHNNRSNFVERDVGAVRGDDLRGMWGGGPYRLLAGCAPCQSFSTYSRKGRLGRTDEKWALVAAFGRLVRESRPDFVTMENVPQLLDHEVFSEFLKSLDSFHVWFDTVQCADFGVPQTRKRLVLLASRFKPISLQPKKSSKRPTVRAAISHLPKLAAGETDAVDEMHTAPKLSELNLTRIRASRPGGTWRDWPAELISECHRKKSGGTYPGVYGRMEWDSPAPTITTQCYGYGNGRFGHPEQDRAISLREAAILQTFPENYRFSKVGRPAKFNIVGRLIGNAVPVLLGKAIAEVFVRHVEEIRWSARGK